HMYGTLSPWTLHIFPTRLSSDLLPFAEALEKVRSGIQKLNAKIGSPDGYHETITVAYVRVIASRREAGEEYEDFRERNPDLFDRSEEHTSELQSRGHLVCRLLLD